MPQSQSTKVQLITAGSMGGNLTSTAQGLGQFDQSTIQCVWSAGTSPVGTLKLYASNDSGTTYSQIPGTSLAVSGNSGSHVYLIDFPFEKIYVDYARTSGTATLNVYFMGQDR